MSLSFTTLIKPANASSLQGRIRCIENLITSVISLVNVIKAARITIAIPNFFVPNFLYKIKSKIKKKEIIYYKSHSFYF